MEETPKVESESKKPWASKSVWVGVLVAIAPFIPWAGQYVTQEVAISVIGAIIVALRLITKKEIVLKD